TVTFAVGETSKSIEVLVLGDKAVEGNEAFAITLSDPSAGLALGTAAASFTIINDDLPPVVQTGTELNNTLRGTARVDEIYGLGGDDKLTGGSLGDELSGGAGNDTLDGGTGADHMRGGDDNDTYYVDNAGDIVDETGTTGTDTVISTISFSLVEGGQVLGAFENLTLAGRAVSATGNALDNIITGNTGANTLYGMDGADTLIGGRGADTLYGGNGDDKYYVDAAGDVVSEAGSDGTDTVYASVTFNLSDALHVFGDVENLVLTGKGSIKGTGNDLANTITGNSGANVLSGLGGNDILDGGAGNDTLEGGEGDDTLTGGAGRDIFVFMAAGFGADQITDFTDASDKLRISKSLALSIADLTISGNGTADIDISIGADTIHLHGAAPITLDAADFLFV
ncbi:MAG: calcium-binding protein, partial [Hyphomicrobiales bacterium]